MHRDLASRNVLLDALDNALISDFGLSAVGRVETQNAVTEFSFFRGPYKWMAPESLSFNQFSTKSDVWALGVTLWEVLARRLPFEKKDIYEVKDEVVRARLRLPLPAKWPEPWRNLLVSMWRTDPAMRPDCATIATWLEKMHTDFEAAGAAQYGPDPVLSDAEFAACVPAPMGASGSLSGQDAHTTSVPHLPTVGAAADATSSK